MNERITARFGRYIYCKYDYASYVHKYYLPFEIKNQIRPSDIRALVFHDFKDEEFDIWNGVIPDQMSDCTIYYKDIRLKKIVSGEIVRQALQSYWHYVQDCRAELTPEEVRAALTLNEYLMSWEKEVQNECIRLTEEMELRLRRNDPFLTDYEIELEIDFYLREDDPFLINDPNFSEHDQDSDVTLICVLKDIKGRINAEEAADPEYTGIGGNWDHNEGINKSDSELFTVRHCASFHELYSHLGIPFKHMERIGRIYTDIKVIHQNGITIDLKGRKVQISRDEKG